MESRSADESPRDVYPGEGTPGSENRRLRANLQTVFRDARLQYADGPPLERAALRVALRQVCMDARRAGLRAEELLVIIKDVWSGLPAGVSRLPSVHGDERLNYVISTCVDEYYAPVSRDREISPER
jgi:hypothetical protein